MSLNPAAAPRRRDTVRASAEGRRSQGLGHAAGVRGAGGRALPEGALPAPALILGLQYSSGRDAQLHAKKGLFLVRAYVYSIGEGEAIPPRFHSLVPLGESPSL